MPLQARLEKVRQRLRSASKSFPAVPVNINEENQDSGSPVEIAFLGDVYTNKEMKGRQHGYMEDIYKGKLPPIDFHLVSSWLNCCWIDHGPECGNLQHADNMSSHDEGIILVDVLRECLVESTISTDFETGFVALSYVSGVGKRFHLTRKTLKQLQTPGSLSSCADDIPNIILDAIKVVSRIEQQYLWVDQLCIVEDDMDSRRSQVANMGAIYNNALLTIVAVNAPSADSKHFGSVNMSSWLGENTLETWDDFIRPTNPDQILKVIDRSKYNSRAWTFQERYLSRRKLYLLEDQMYFECGQGIWCYNLGSSPSISEKILLDQPSIDEKWSIASQISGWTTNVEQMDLEFAFNFYSRIAEAYTARHLTRSNDIGHAFSGIVEILGMNGTQQFLHCLPEDLLHRALLWIPFNKAERRSNPLSPEVASPFPSWSWIGWTGPISYEFAFSPSGFVPLKVAPGMTQMSCFSFPRAKKERPPFNRFMSGLRSGKATILFPRRLSASAAQSPMIDIMNSTDFDENEIFDKGYVLRFIAEVINIGDLEGVPIASLNRRDLEQSNTTILGARSKTSCILLRSSGVDVGMLLGINILGDLWQMREQCKLVAISERPKMTKTMYAVDAYGNYRYESLEYPAEPNESTMNEDWEQYNVLVIKPVGKINEKIIYERVAVGFFDISQWENHRPVTLDLLLG